jgi:DUF4097 and DUF4098 domain-containing protein YvlB
MRARVAIALVLFASTAADAQFRDDFERVVPFNPGGSFQVENRNGSIEIGTWSESSVQIRAEKKAKSQGALDDLEIAVEGSGDSVSVETIYHRRRESGEVSYYILLPAEARITAQTANGSVTVEGIHGHVDAQTVNGSVKVEDVVGEVEVETINGSIRASYERAADGRHRFSTTNGSVRIYLPRDSGGQLDAETVNGSIEVDFPVTMTRSSRRHFRGSFGSGAGSFEISTVNGSVKILAN